MKNIEIKIQAKTAGGLEASLREISKLLLNGYPKGEGENSSMKYNYKVDGYFPAPRPKKVYKINP